VPGAEVHIFDGGHFSLDVQPDLIADLTRDYCGACRPMPVADEEPNRQTTVPINWRGHTRPAGSG
jgi:hypothetical protein